MALLERFPLGYLATLVLKKYLSCSKSPENGGMELKLEKEKGDDGCEWKIERNLANPKDQTCKHEAQE